jgi:hypothetical protein
MQVVHVAPPALLAAPQPSPSQPIYNFGQLPAIIGSSNNHFPENQQQTEFSKAFMCYVTEQLNAELQYLPRIEKLLFLEGCPESQMRSAIEQGVKGLFNECISQAQCKSCPFCSKSITLTFEYKSHLEQHVKELDFLSKPDNGNEEMFLMQIKYLYSLKIVQIENCCCSGHIIPDTEAWGCRKTFSSRQAFRQHLFGVSTPFQGSTCLLDLKRAIREASSTFQGQVDVLERWRTDQWFL